jgi:hypothetical protein
VIAIALGASAEAASLWLVGRGMGCAALVLKDRSKIAAVDPSAAGLAPDEMLGLVRRSTVKRPFRAVPARDRRST